MKPFVQAQSSELEPNQRLKLSHGCLFASLTGSWRSLTRSLGDFRWNYKNGMRVGFVESKKRIPMWRVFFKARPIHQSLATFAARKSSVPECNRHQVFRAANAISIWSISAFRSCFWQQPANTMCFQRPGELPEPFCSSPSKAASCRNATGIELFLRRAWSSL